MIMVIHVLLVSFFSSSLVPVLFNNKTPDVSLLLFLPTSSPLSLSLFHLLSLPYVWFVSNRDNSCRCETRKIASTKVASNPPYALGAGKLTLLPTFLDGCSQVRGI
jgi:hypothetical protein